MKRTLIAATLLAPLAAFAANQQQLTQDGSYAFGYQFGQTAHAQMPELSAKSFSQGFNDAFAGQAPSLSKAKMKAGFAYLQTSAQQKIQAHHAKAAADNGAQSEAFLAANAKKAGVVTLKNGLQYKIVKKGTGPQPTATSTVTVNYEGSLPDGKVFDSSYKRGQPATFKLNQVIQAWQQALPMMHQGAVWMLYVPANLAYGQQGAGGMIGPNQALVFKVQLIKVN